MFHRVLVRLHPIVYLDADFIYIQSFLLQFNLLQLQIKLVVNLDSILFQTRHVNAKIKRNILLLVERFDC